jgi:hypothetical protein
MTLVYRWNRFTNMWAAYGPPEEMHIGFVEVQKANGELKGETITRISKPFATVDGPRCYGTLRAVPTRHYHRAVDQIQQQPVITRSRDGRTVEIRIDDED